MQRLHINLKVTQLEKNIAFYSGLFGQQPSVQKADYAKWLLEQPALNFSLALAGEAGLEHLGIETDKSEELNQLFERLDGLEGTKNPEGHTQCCYARSEKSWIRDPQGVSWEIFRTYGTAEQLANTTPAQACCPA